MYYHRCPTMPPTVRITPLNDLWVKGTLSLDHGNIVINEFNITVPIRFCPFCGQCLEEGKE